MKQYILLADHPPLKKDEKLFPVPGYIDPIPYATEAELAKRVPSNFWFESFLTTHTEMFKEME